MINDETIPNYVNITETFVKSIGYLNYILNFNTYEEDFKQYKEVLLIILKWAVEFEKCRNLDFIDNEVLISVYEIVDDLQTKYICNDTMGSESEFSDYIVNLIWQLRVIYKNYVEGGMK